MNQEPQKNSEQIEKSVAYQLTADTLSEALAIYNRSVLEGHPYPAIFTYRIGSLMLAVGEQFNLPLLESTLHGFNVGLSLVLFSRQYLNGLHENIRIVNPRDEILHYFAVVSFGEDQQGITHSEHARILRGECGILMTTKDGNLVAVHFDPNRESI